MAARFPFRLSLAGLALAGGFALLAVAYWGAERDAERGRQRQLALRQALAVAGQTGWALPAITLERSDGSAVSSGEVLRGGDGVVVFTTTCPHCARQAPGWPALGGRLAAEGGRLVLLSPDRHPEIADFLARHGAGELEVYRVPEVDDLLRIGATAVPHHLRLDPLGQVTEQSGGGETASLAASLALMEGTLPGVEEAVWSAIAAGLLGNEAETGPPRPLGPAATAVAVAHRGERWTLVAVPPELAFSQRVAAVALLGPDGRLERLLPTSWSLDALAAGPPPPELLSSVRGLTPGQARQRVATAAQEPGPLQPHRRALAELLTRLEDATRSLPDDSAAP